ncbi:hypothetical protein QYF36_026466 [Acer negundo]|nr:hypothetical protein QYF36_026466 [Acer negundo]
MSEEKELANLLHKRRKGETTERNKDLRLVGSTLLQEPARDKDRKEFPKGGLKVGKVAKTSKRKELTRESICLNAGLKKSGCSWCSGVNEGKQLAKSQTGSCPSLSKKARGVENTKGQQAGCSPRGGVRKPTSKGRVGILLAQKPAEWGQLTPLTDWPVFIGHQVGGRDQESPRQGNALNKQLTYLPRVRGRRRSWGWTTWLNVIPYQRYSIVGQGVMVSGPAQLSCAKTYRPGRDCLLDFYSQDVDPLCNKHHTFFKSPAAKPSEENYQKASRVFSGSCSFIFIQRSRLLPEQDVRLIQDHYSPWPLLYTFPLDPLVSSLRPSAFLRFPLVTEGEQNSNPLKLPQWIDRESSKDSFQSVLVRSPKESESGMRKKKWSSRLESFEPFILALLYHV